MECCAYVHLHELKSISSLFQRCSSPVCIESQEPHCFHFGMDLGLDTVHDLHVFCRSSLTRLSHMSSSLVFVQCRSTWCCCLCSCVHCEVWDPSLKARPTSTADSYLVWLWETVTRKFTITLTKLSAAIWSAIGCSLPWPWVGWCSIFLNLARGFHDQWWCVVSWIDANALLSVAE